MQDVATALRRLVEADESTGRHVEVAWQVLSGGSPEYRPSQHDVQRYLWMLLPAMVRAPDRLPPLPDWRPVTEALARFFELIGSPRYAALCRVESTVAILTSAGDEPLCTALADEAMHASGVVPPQGGELAWLARPGTVEAGAMDTVSRVLELAIADDLLQLGQQDTDIRRAQVAAQVLNSPVPGDGRTWLELVLAERLRAWSQQCGSQTQRELLVRTGGYVAKPAEPDPDDLATALHPLATLLDECAGPGAKLTSAGYLPTGLVAMLVMELPACERWVSTGRSEAHWQPIMRLRALAERIGLVRVVNGRLRRTELGDTASGDPRLLFTALCHNTVAVAEPPLRAVIDTVYPMLLLEDTVDPAAMAVRLAAVLGEAGADGELTGEPAGDPDGGLLGLVLGELDVLEATEPAKLGGRVGLTEFGRTLVLGTLRARVLDSRLLPIGGPA